MWSQNNYTAHPASLLSKLLLLANPEISLLSTFAGKKQITESITVGYLTT